MTLFACDHALNAHQSLPEFLPSTRVALENLKERIQSNLIHSGGGGSGAMGLPLIYALAEMDLMEDMVGCLEEMLAVCRELFGSSSWISANSDVPLELSMSEHEQFQ
jgi:hypothetical protein